MDKTFTKGQVIRIIRSIEPTISKLDLEQSLRTFGFKGKTAHIQSTRWGYKRLD